MLMPDKYMNIDLSVLNVGAIILKSLKNTPSQKYEEVLKYVILNLGESAENIFLYALSFLFLIGKVAYIKESDTISLCES